MREFGEAFYLRSTKEELTRELVAQAAPLVEESFRRARADNPELESYSFVAGDPVQAGDYWFHPFGWYAVLPIKRRIRR